MIFDLKKKKEKEKTTTIIVQLKNCRRPLVSNLSLSSLLYRSFILIPTLLCNLSPLPPDFQKKNEEDASKNPTKGYSLMEGMDHEAQECNNPRRSRSLGRTSSIGSSMRGRTLSLSSAHCHHMDDDIENESVSEAGDIGDRALGSNRFRESGRLSFSLDGTLDSGAVVPVSLHDMIPSVDEKLEEEKEKEELPWLLDYTSCLIHLAVFGILGVCTRYLLQKLFGPGVGGITSNGSILYLDLPSNMVGSFLMGWIGVVFKGDISSLSNHLAIGLSTGYLGSLTTFSGWNQKMLDLSIEGKWLSAFLGFLLGLFLASHSIIFGVETAKGFNSFLERRSTSSKKGFISSWKVDSYKRHLAAMVLLVILLGALLILCGILEKREFGSGSTEAELWLGCIVAAPGVWIRWHLARLNGRGLGKTGMLKWIPFGTLIANIAAACFMAVLATVKKGVNTKTSNTVASGIQLGLLGCMSTVSTFMAEFNAMRDSDLPLRAYVYAMITIIPSFALGILIYSVPVWVDGYN